jgi:hypothetical protein
MMCETTLDIRVATQTDHEQIPNSSPAENFTHDEFAASLMTIV